MDKELFYKSLKYFAITMALMFTAPMIIYSAFKNQGHPWFWPVLIIGLVLAIAAIGMGFYSLKVMLRGIFGKKNSNS